MKARQDSVLETLRRTKDFLDANARLLEAVNTSSARRNLDDVVAQLTLHIATQNGSIRASTGETARQRTLRVALRYTRMRPIAAVARHKLQNVPEFQALKMPKGNPTVGALIAAARGMADAAKKHAQVLIENGLRDDFLEQLLAAASVLEKSIDERNVLRGARSGSTAGLTAEEARGRTILRVLDCEVRPRLGDNAILLAQWKLATQVKRMRALVAATATPTSTPVVPGTPAAPSSAVNESAASPISSEAA